MTVFILACYGVLVYQLYVWQVRDAESYRAEAVTQQLKDTTCLLYTSPSPRDRQKSRMPSSA